MAGGQVKVLGRKGEGSRKMPVLSWAGRHGLHAGGRQVCVFGGPMGR